jgi:hypothetical protein
MDTFVLCFMWFVIGFASGAMTLIYLAIRPQGYLANNGLRWKLTQVHGAGQPSS